MRPAIILLLLVPELWNADGRRYWGDHETDFSQTVGCVLECDDLSDQLFHHSQYYILERRVWLDPRHIHST
jgi:hypothetical protein